MIIKIEKFGDGGILFGEMTICASVMKRLRLRCTEYEVDFSGEEIKYNLCPCGLCQQDTPSSLVRFFAPDFQTVRKGNLEFPAREGTLTLWRTKQSIFDQVAQHLLTQNRQAYDAGCVYRTERDGEVLRCAAGCLIPDDLYTKEMDNLDEGGGSVYRSGLVQQALKKERIRDLQLVFQLQRVHDGNSVEYWAEELRRLAESEGLQWTVQSAVSS